MKIEEKIILLLLLFISGTAVAGKEQKLDTIIGIDLGATYSYVGVCKNGQVQIIADEQGNRSTPSWVAFTDSETLIGEAAKNQAPLNVDRTVFDIKCLIGKKFDDPDVQRDIKFLPYKVVNKEGKPYIQVKVKGETKVFSPEEISASLLTRMKEIAETYLGKKIKDAVITVPAYFSDAQRQATKDAGTIAGLNVVRIINEPTAVGIAYGLHKNVGEKNILVYDLGGRTFDVSILNIDNGMFDVLATSGDTPLGGDYFDHRVVDYFIKLIKKKYKEDISKDNRALWKLRKECERAKRALGSRPQVQVEIESLSKGINFSEPLTRARFEELNMDLFRNTLGPVKRVLDDAGLKKTDIHEIVPVGGSARIPKVKLVLEEMFDGKEPLKGINPDEAVAYGAAVQGGILSGECGELNDVSYGFEVVPYGLGIETVDGVVIEVIPSKSVFPIKKSYILTTSQDKQTTISFKVFNSDCVINCHELGRFNLTGIPPAPRELPQIEVTFKIDSNGVLHVTAADKTRKNSHPITVIGMWHEDIGRMVVEESLEFENTS